MPQRSVHHVHVLGERELGRIDSTKRTAEQTTIGRFWLFTGPQTYNPIVRQVGG